MLSNLQVTSITTDIRASITTAIRVYHHSTTRLSPQHYASITTDRLRFDLKPAARREKKPDSNRDTEKQKALFGTGCLAGRLYIRGLRPLRPPRNHEEQNPSESWTAEEKNVTAQGQGRDHKMISHGQEAYDDRIRERIEREGEERRRLGLPEPPPWPPPTREELDRLKPKNARRKSRKDFAKWM